MGLTGLCYFWAAVALLEGGPGRTGAEEPMVVASKADPFVMSRGSELQGFLVDLLNQLSALLHFDPQLQLVRDGQYGRTGASGHWTGLIGELERQEATVALAPLTMTAARGQVVSFTTPFLYTGIGILRRENPSPQSGSFCLLSPFSGETWAGIVAAYLLTCLGLFITARLSPSELTGSHSDKQNPSFLDSLCYGAGAYALQGPGPQFKAVSVRLVATTWWVFAALVLSVYAASLSALLRSPAEQGPVNSFEDLIGQKVMEFGTINGSSTHQFFQSSKDPLHRMVLERMERQQGRALVSSHEEGVERVLSSNYALIGETVSLDLAVARHCGLVRLPDVTVLRGLSLATTKGSPWAEELSVALLQLAESGVLEALRHKWWEPSCAPQEPLRRGSLGPQSLGPAFLILAAGLTLGLAVAVGELALKTCRVDARPEQSRSSAFAEEVARRLCGKEGAAPSHEDPEKVKP
ncbi:probable glutamate receptor isoform X2 [Ornithorhynchus anatinus]|uniref:probable glutamate receptor isoform X2 n=1 Tax=Ornithorhynchus anatinus TaxID=9258 RepID=UPI0019D44497|nr:probable glutamate receptor isoform X2 [Ornithorhynchus anatinus]